MATGTAKNAKANNTAKVAAQPSTDKTTAQPTLVESLAKANDLQIRFAKPKAEKQKSTRPFCAYTRVTERGPKGEVLKTEGCQLRSLDGRDRCVNHVPAEERLTADEATALLALVGGLDEAQQIRLITRTLGWYKVKQLVSGTAAGDVVLNELVG